MKIKTSELTGAALDWAVAKCENYPVKMSKTGFLIFSDPLIQCGPKGTQYSPSTIWSQGGPIIERERMGVWPSEEGDREEVWGARMLNTYISYGPTPLIAAMRCYVSSRLGDEVDVPEELV